MNNETFSVRGVANISDKTPAKGTFGNNLAISPPLSFFVISSNSKVLDHPIQEHF